MPIAINERLLSWGSDVEDATLAQAARTAALPIVAGHVALMPDAHVGIGATVGSVIPTKGAIIAAAVGVDLGCGMAAVETDLSAVDLPDDLSPLLSQVGTVVPAGVGKGHDGPACGPGGQWMLDHRPPSKLSPDLAATALRQLGTLGSGNHFVEVDLDERDQVWLVLHSGSRGIGNKLATAHIGKARKLVRDGILTGLADPDLAWFTQGTPEFADYIADMLWAQDYARANRDLMVDTALAALLGFVGRGRAVSRVDCHHNFAALETHDGQEVWVTRKGAIRAEVGDPGIIPGSMGTATYIVAGKGEASSWRSCAHGAGRRMSRSRARRELSAESLAVAMGGRTWLAEKAEHLVDEHPDAYKDIVAVMADQADLVEVTHTLRQVLNYKG
ncbi:MAG: RtcB family protein [Acidimicrobiales bacterium]